MFITKIITSSLKTMLTNQQKAVDKFLERDWLKNEQSLFYKVAV